jgi:hypothetical protein
VNVKWLVSVLIGLASVGCRENRRIGEHVLVEYDGQRCAGYIVDKKSESRFRVHFEFEGYDWEDDVTIDRILRRVDGPVAPCSMPRTVRATLGLLAAPKAAASPYRVGDRVRVRWRESVYPAVITGVPAPDRVSVHYQGHEDVWDETISVDRIVTERR